MLVYLNKGNEGDGGTELSGSNQNQWKPVAVLYNYLISLNLCDSSVSSYLYSFEFTDMAVCDKPSGGEKMLSF